MKQLSGQAARGLQYFFGYHPADRRRAARYGMAILLTLLAAAARMSLAPAESGGRFVTFSLAATLVAIYGGFGPAMLTTLLSMFIVSYALIPPYFHLAFDHPSEALVLNLTFFVNQMLVCTAIGLMQRYQRVHTDNLESLVRHNEARVLVEKHFHNTFEHAAVGIAHLSPSGLWLRANDALCEMLGYTRDELKLMDYQSMTHPEHRQEDIAQARRVLEGRQKSYSLDKRYMRRDGSPLWTNVTTALVRKEDGEPDYFISVIQDISDRKAAEARVREQDRQLAVISDHIPGGIALLDRKLRFRYVSREYGRFFGKPTSEIIGMSMEELLGPQAYEKARPHAQRALWGETTRYENHLVSPSGEEIYIDVTSVPERTEGGKVKGIINVISFITDYKLTELALIESKSLLLQAQSLAHMTSWVYDPQARTYTFGESAREILGYAGRAVTPEQNMAIVHPQDRDKLAAAWVAALRGTQKSFIAEFRATVHGESGWFYSKADIVRDERGRAVHVYGVTQNITDRKLIEHYIQNLNAELEQRVKERTTALTVANEELESFAYAVAHDLRSPLRAINGFTQALLEESGDRMDEAMRSHFDRITRASRKMGGLIDGLLELSRHSRKELTPSQVDVSELARKILADLALTDPARQVRVEIQPGLKLYADAQLVDSLMHNLLENAWKYTARTPDALIRVQSELVERHLHISVADNGAGFDMAYAGDLFKPFHRLHRDTDFPGVGIGLATAQRIVQRHGGSIHASSTPGQGAVFRFWLARGGAAPDGAAGARGPVR